MSKFMDNIKGFINSTSWKIQKHSPEICLAVGIVTTIAGVVTACRATIKAQEVLEDHKKQMETIHKCEETGKTTNEKGEIVEYTHEDAKKDSFTTLIKTGVKCLRLYLMSLILIGLSIFCQIKGYKTLSERLAMASAAYAALAAKFKDYRKRVRDKFGEEEEKAIYHNMRAKDITMTTTDEDGNVVEQKQTVMIADDDDYTALFTKYNSDGTVNTAWNPDIDRNLFWLRSEQSYLNSVLQLRNGKPVTLNEVRHRLGLPLTAKGQAVGWTYEPNNPNHKGDNYIDFGIDKIYRAYDNGEEVPGEASLVLEFNVDGDILYSFDKYKDKKSA